MRSRQLYILASTLVLIGLGLFLYKSLALKFPLRADTTTDVWNIEARVVVDADGGPVKIRLLIPSDHRRLRILDENFISRGYGLSTTTRDDGNREAVWSIREASGRQILYYQAKITTTLGNRTSNDQAPPPAEKRPGKKKAPPSGKNKSMGMPGAPGTSDLSELELTAARVIGAEIRQQSADLDTLVAALMQRLNSATLDRNSRLLMRRRGGRENRLRVAVDVLTVAGIPAQVVHGIRLEESGRGVPVQHWLQAHDGRRWRYYDATTGQPLKLTRYAAWWQGSEPAVRVDGGHSPRVTFSVNRNQLKGLSVASSAGRADSPWLVTLSLLSLPIETQGVYRVLLVIPLGVLMLVVLRNVVGLKTFGTFMPVLIALAFRQTQLLWGIVLFSVIVALGLSIRFYLDRLKLLLVPRLAAVLTVVVILMALLSIVSHRLGFERGLSVALFPMVIMTMTIERMSIVWDERGAQEALLQGLGSFAAAALAYLVMFQPALEHLVFVFPELLLIVLAVVLLFGRYSGYRLSELGRFKVLARKP